MLFTSNWGRSGTEEIEMYVIGLPPDVIDQLPLDWLIGVHIVE